MPHFGCIPLCLLYFLFILIAENCVNSRRQEGREDVEIEDLVNKLAESKLTKNSSDIFHPLLTKFPDTVRIGKEAAKYRAELLSTLPARARKNDSNLFLTGESCARGLGDLYEV